MLHYVYDTTDESKMNRAVDMHDLNEAISAPYREKIESRGSTARDQLSEKRLNRRVRFQSAQRTTFIRSSETSKTIENLKNSIWYQPADIQKFQWHDEMLIKKYRSIVRNKQRMGRINLKEIDILTTEMESEMRGLEDEFNVLAQQRYQRRLYDSCRAVLVEQERQRDLWSNDSNANQSFLLDAEMIRKVYADSSRNSKLIAYSLGLSDAAFVRQFQKNSPIHDDAFRNGTNKKRETKMTLQKDRAPLAHKSKIEKENTKRTASSLLRQRQLSHINALNAVGATLLTTRVSI